MIAVITLFETFDNKYKHDSIIIKVDNEDESKVVQELAFANGLSWINGGETEYLSYPKNGGCLLLSLDKGNISFNDRLSDLMSFLKMSGRNYDSKVYERKDLRTV